MKTTVGRNNPCPCGSGKKYKKCHEGMPKTQPGTLRKAYSIKDGDDFMGRFMFGNGNIRSCVYDDKDRLAYDKSYNAVFQNLIEMKRVKEKCQTIISSHRKEIEKGVDGKHHGNQIDVENPIDDELNIFFKDFFIRGIMATGGLIKHSQFMDVDISFLFSDVEKKFKKGLKKFPLKEDDPRFQSVDNFIKDHKSTWYVAFKELRRKIEHEGWSVPQVKYFINNEKKVQIVLPKIENWSIEELMDVCWENIMNLCEELIVFMLSLKLDEDKVIVFVPEEKRDKNFPVRYIVSHKSMPGVKLQC